MPDRRTIPSADRTSGHFNPPPWSRPEFAATAILVLVTLVVYAQVLNNQFVRWDDDQTLQHNPHLNPPTLQSVGYLWTHEHMHLWVPATYTVWASLAWLCYATEQELAPAAFHGASLLIHVLTVIVLFQLLRRLCANTSATAIGAAIFAVHPVQVESIAWASGLKDLLCGLLTWLAILQYIVAMQETNRRARRIRLALAMTAFMLGMLSKPTAMVAPALALAIDVIALRRPIKESMSLLWPAFVLAIPCIIWTRLVQPAAADAIAIPLFQRPLIAADALAFYAGKLLWPVHLAVDYGRTPAIALSSHWRFVAWMVPAAACMIAATSASRLPLLATGIVVVVIGVSPVLGLVSFDFQKTSTVADHYPYLSMAGVAMVAVELARRLKPLHSIMIAAPLVIVLGIQSVVQSRHWQSTITLFTHTLAVNPTSYIAHNNLAAGYLDRNDPPRAQQHATEALKLKPDHAPAMVSLGAALAAQNRLPEAADLYQQALQLRPDDPNVLANFGGLLAQMGRADEASACLRRAIELDPLNAQAHLNLGTLEAGTNPASAMEHLRHAVRLAPHNLTARTNLGFVLLSQGQRSQAAEQFAAALRIDPNHRPAREGLAAATRLP